MTQLVTYIIFVVGKQNENLHVFTNRFGTYQAYHLSNKEGNAIATPYISLAKQSSDKTLDWEGITSFFGQGYFANDNTFLKSIKILEPASHYHFDNQLQKKKSKRYWDWEYTVHTKNTDQRIEEIHATLSQSISVATRGKDVALPISGGLDSRTLVGLLTGEEE